MKWTSRSFEVPNRRFEVLPESAKPNGVSENRRWLITGGVLVLTALLIFALWNSVTFIFSLYNAATEVVLQTSPVPARTEAQAPPFAPIIPPFLAKFKDHLITLSWGQRTDFDYIKLAGIDYIAFYYSASWCPPCRAFTPRLVSFYRDFKAHHSNFELIFVNHDSSEEDMLSYMRDDSMPWPAIRFADIDDAELNANDNCGPGIPSLCLLDSRGRFLAGSYDGSGNYIPPDMILDEIRRRVP